MAMKKIFGMEMVIDFAGGTGYQSKDDGDNLDKFIVELCETIDMERHGPFHKEWFGNNSVEGWSGIQLITTSSITMHFCPYYEDYKDTSNSGYINVFSCKNFTPNDVVLVIKKYFNPDIIDAVILDRKKPDKKNVTFMDTITSAFNNLIRW